MPKELIPYVIDFTGMTMNNTLTNDAVMPPSFVEIRNVDLSLAGHVRKRYGIGNVSTNATPNVWGAGTKYPIAAVAGYLPGIYTDVTLSNLLAYSYNLVHSHEAVTAIWDTVGASIAITSDGLPFHISWTIDVTAVPQVVFSKKDIGVIACEVTGPNARTVLGGATFTSANCSEFFQDRQWVGGTMEGGAFYSDRLRWSITGDTNTWTGSGSGYLDLRGPGGGTVVTELSITGLRVYRNNLWIGFSNALYVLTGTTATTYGKRQILSANGIIGSTMFATKDFLFWIDYEGIWQFNGSTAINVVRFTMIDRWKTLSVLNDISKATASWDDQLQVYMVYFPAVQELWRYSYITSQWEIWTFSATDAIQCISPPITRYGENFTVFALGAATGGRVFRMKSTLVADDGVAITASIKTGHVRLGELSGGKPGDRFRLHYLDIEAANQSETGIIKATFTIDGVAQTTVSLATTDAGSSANTFPTAYDGFGGTKIDLSGIDRVGKYMQLELKDDDADSRCDIRRAVLWYERLSY